MEYLSDNLLLTIIFGAVYFCASATLAVAIGLTVEKFFERIFPDWMESFTDSANLWPFNLSFAVVLISLWLFGLYLIDFYPIIFFLFTILLAFFAKKVTGEVNRFWRLTLNIYKNAEKLEEARGTRSFKEFKNDWMAALTGLPSLISQFVFRCTGWEIAAPSLKNFNGIDYVEIGNRRVAEIGVPFDFPLKFNMTRENEADRTFKSLGFRGEFQTGDAVFDGAVYIACDHPFFHQALKESPEAREIISQFLQVGCEQIWSDGKFLWVKHEYLMSRETEKWLTLLNSLRERLAFSLANKQVRRKDVLFRKILLTRVVIWICALYSFVACFNFIVRIEDFHVDMGQLRLYGTISAVGIAILFFAFIFAFLRRSSYAHRLFMLETGFLVVFSVPILGIQGVSDLNRKLDTSQPMIVHVTVSEVWRERGGRHGFFYSPFHMSVANPDSKIQFAKNINISGKVFSGLHNNKPIELEIGSGALGLAWYRKIDGVAMYP